MTTASTRVMAWAAAWESSNPDKVAALYARDATHASAVVRQIFPEAQASVLKGRDQIREYASRGMARFTTLRLRDTISSGIRHRRRGRISSAFEYRC
jgi:nuclear transport factor 2 (NTF2) superfamily protein